MRIAPRPVAAAPWYLRPLFAAQRRRYGAVLDSSLVWARSPRLLLGVSLLFGALDRKSSPLPPDLRGLILVRVSQLNDCPFCVDVNAAALLKGGGQRAKLDALAGWRDSDAFDAGERAALDYAEAMTLSDRTVDDALFRRVAEQFDDDAIVELTGLIAFQNMSTKFNNALAIPPQGFCELPPPGASRPANS